jgi:hypothetical protein
MPLSLIENVRLLAASVSHNDFRRILVNANLHEKDLCSENFPPRRNRWVEASLSLVSPTKPAGRSSNPGVTLTGPRRLNIVTGLSALGTGASSLHSD